VVGEAKVTSGSLGVGFINGELSFDRFGVVAGEEVDEGEGVFFLFLPSFLNQLVAFPPTRFSSSPIPRPKPINLSALFTPEEEGESVTIVIVDLDRVIPP
jgi:hypothetical protein